VSDAVYAPLVVCTVLALAARWLAAHLPPRSGTWVLAVATATGGLCTLWALGLLALSLVDDLPPVARDDDLDLPVADALSVLAALAVAVALARVALHLRRQRRLGRELRILRALPGSDLVVLPHPRARAFAVPGTPGRILVTDTMLRALTPAQRRVLLAHEQAHLDAAHALALSLAWLGASANPLLAPAARAVAYLSERHADEVAAAAVGDRALAAQALVAAALATAEDGYGEAGLVPSFHHVGVLDRLAALNAPRRQGHRAGLLLVLLAISVAVPAIGYATGDFAHLVGTLLAP
jgi:Zn-dependent protease with chaperone function